MPNTYTWVDTQNLEKAKTAITTLVSAMQDSGAAWRRSWIAHLPIQVDAIRQEIFDEVCQEYHFIEITSDEAVMARIETRKRIHGVLVAAEDLNHNNNCPAFGGWCILNRKISKHFADIIEIDADGWPSLPDDYETQLETYCTYEIPEAWRDFCDAIRDNETGLLDIVAELKAHRLPIPGWLFSLKSGAFTVKDFAQTFNLKFV